jgi:hypothetical protein
VDNLPTSKELGTVGTPDQRRIVELQDALRGLRDYTVEMAQKTAAYMAATEARIEELERENAELKRKMQ